MSQHNDFAADSTTIISSKAALSSPYNINHNCLCHFKIKNTTSGDTEQNRSQIYYCQEKRQVNNIEEPAAAEHQHNLAKISTSEGEYDNILIEKDIKKTVELQSNNLENERDQILDLRQDQHLKLIKKKQSWYLGSENIITVKSDNKKVEDVKSMIVNTELGVVDIGKEQIHIWRFEKINLLEIYWNLIIKISRDKFHFNKIKKQLISSKSTPTPTSTTITNSSGINESMTTQQKEHQLSHLANQASNNSIQLAKHVPRNRNKYCTKLRYRTTTISTLSSSSPLISGFGVAGRHANELSKLLIC
ncbi:1657_t:CDS:2 [Entrophospora sp. SA101]|nr:1657_t:CDS:2 [Entrophospora sp. SA101]